MGITSFTFITTSGLYAPVCAKLSTNLSVHIVARISVTHSYMHVCYTMFMGYIFIYIMYLSTAANMNSLKLLVAKGPGLAVLPLSLFPLSTTCRFSVSGSRTTILNGNVHPRSVLKKGPNNV